MVQQTILFCVVVESLRFYSTSDAMSECSFHVRLRLLVGEVDPAEPAMRMFIAFIHHWDVSLSLFTDDEKLAQQSSNSQMFDVSESGLHETVQIKSGWVVIMIAEYR